MEYEDFELQIGPRSAAGLLVRVLRSPAGEGEALVRPPDVAAGSVSLDGVFRNLAGEALELSGAPSEIGGALFTSLFTGAVGALFQRSLSRIDPPRRGLRIRLRINLRDRTLDALQSLPWELLYRDDTEDFLALSRLTPVVRSLDVPRPTALRPYQPPLRILAVLAQDPSGVVLSLGRELDQLREAVKGNPAVCIDVLENPETSEIRRALDRGGFHVLHYMGHGDFDLDTGEGALLFRGTGGDRLTVTGRHLATKIKDIDSLRLVVLNACETAVGASEIGHQPFAGVAAALVLGGVPAVVAMQSPIEDDAALAFGHPFYDRLARGGRIEEAVAEGRQGIHSLDPHGSSWAVPVLFLRAAADELFAITEAPLRVPEPTEPPPRSRIVDSGRPLILLVGLLLIAGSLFIAWNTLERPRAEALKDTKTPVVPADTASAEPAPAAPTEPRNESIQQSKSESAVSLPSSVPQGSSRTVSVDLEEGVLRFELVGASPPGLSAALRKEGKQFAGSGIPAAGRTVRVNIEEPACLPSGSGTTCRVEAIASLHGAGALDSVSGVGWQSDEAGALEIAAGKLAHAVVVQLADSLRENSR